MQEKPQFAALCLNDDAEGQKNLVVLIVDCFDTLRVYGKEPEQLQSAIKLFKRVLGKYSWDAINAAFDVYLERNAQMPTPADIVNIIDPPQRWCSETYRQIKERLREGRAFVSDEERNYCHNYEKAHIALARVPS